MMDVSVTVAISVKLKPENVETLQTMKKTMENQFKVIFKNYSQLSLRNSAITIMVVCSRNMASLTEF